MFLLSYLPSFSDQTMFSGVNYDEDVSIASTASTLLTWPKGNSWNTDWLLTNNHDNKSATTTLLYSINNDTFKKESKSGYFSRLPQALRLSVTHMKEILWPAFCLKTGVQSDQEGMIRGLFKYVLFCLDPINILEEKHTEIHQRSFWHSTLQPLI